MASTGDTASSQASVLAPPGPKIADSLAVGLIVLVMLLAAFYPETFISGDLTVGSQRLTPLSFLLPVVAVAAVAYFVNGHKVLRFRLVDWALAAFMAWLLLRNPSGYTAAVAIKYLIYGVGLFYLTALAMQSSSFTRVFQISLMIIVCIVAVYGFVDFVMQRNPIFGSYILKAVPETSNSLHRAASTFAHPVAYGAFLVQVLPFCFYVTFKNAGIKEHLLGIFALVTATISLYLTFSKGSLIAAGLLAVTGLVLLARKNFKTLAVIVVLSAVFIAALFFTFRDDLGIEIADRSGFSFMARELSWQAALQTFAEQPVTGVGLRNGVDSISRHLDRTNLGNETTLPIDNYYLSVLVEEGAIGLLLWLLFLFSIFIYGVNAVRQSSGQRKLLALAAIFSLAGLCLNMFTFDALFMYGNYVFFWIAAGLVRGSITEKRESPASPEPVAVTS